MTVGAGRIMEVSKFCVNGEKRLCFQESLHSAVIDCHKTHTFLEKFQNRPTLPLFFIKSDSRDTLYPEVPIGKNFKKIPYRKNSGGAVTGCHP